MDTRLNKSDYIILAIFYGVSAIINCYSYYLDKNDLLEYLVDIPTITITSLCTILLFMYWLIPNFIVKQKKYFLFAFFGLIILIVNGGVDYAVGFWSGGGDWSKFPTGVRFCLAAISVGSENVGLVFGIVLAKKYFEGQTQFLTIEKRQKENELKLLRSQFDPHFLFNNLNTLDALIDSNSEKAKEYINRLSLIYRYLIQTKDAEVMELSKEIDMAENYIFLLQTRFGNDYNFEIDISSSVEDKFIPTGAIQTLLENVVKHNKTITKESIKTSIIIKEDWLTVTNTKSKPITNKDSLGTGLENLKTRYTLLSEEKPRIKETDTEYTISIPIIKLSS
ncbi:MAG: histidine kinase [Cellulophaga sp.]